MEKRHLYLATISLCVFLFGADASLGTFAHGRGPSPVIEAGRSSLMNYIYGVFSKDPPPVDRGPSANSIAKQREAKAAPTLAEMGDTSNAWLVPYEKARQFRRYPPCSTVMNKSDALKTIMVPVKTNVEWMSFKNNPPDGISFHACYCGRWLSEGNVYAALLDLLGYDPTIVYQYRVPLYGYRPPFSARTPTTNRICEILGCRGTSIPRGRAFDDPDDDAILYWTGSQWDKRPAYYDNWKLHNQGNALFCPE